MKVYGQLEAAALENLSSPPTAGTIGRYFWDTTALQFKVDDGTNIRAMLRNDQKIIIGNNGTANNNVRINRAAAAVLQFVPGGDTTAEGSLSTSVAQLSFRAENYATGSLPSAGNAGRLAYDTTTGSLKYDNGASWSPVAGPGSLTITATKTANYTAAVGEFIPADASGGNFAVTLPTAVGNTNAIIQIQSISTGEVAINTTSGQTVGGRASGDIVLAAIGDKVFVISDGTDWQILDKKETKYFEATGGRAFSVIGAAGNYGNSGGCNFTLGEGTWEIEAQFILAMGSGIASAILQNSGIYAANGADSASQPTQLGSEVIFGDPLYSGLTATNGGPLTYNNTSNPGNNSIWSAAKVKIVVQLTSSQSFYLVSQIDYSTAGTTTVYGHMQAKRIW